MAEVKLSMSLDDIIKSHKESEGKSRARGPKNKRISEMKKTGPRKNLSKPSPMGRAPMGSSLGVRNRGIAKAVNPMRTGPSIRENNAEQRRNRANIEGKWQHDMFVDEGYVPLRRKLQTAPSSGGKLFISNLDDNVSEEDIKELFAIIGPLSSSKILYDRSGRTEGKAEVVYKNHQDAEKAMKKYNNVALDGKKMVIKMIDGSVIHTLTSGISVTKASTSADEVTGRSGIRFTRNFQQGLKAVLPRRS